MFILNCVNGSWKLPVGYSLITALSGEQKANVIKICFGNASWCRCESVQLMFDTARSNVCAVERLEVDFDINTEKICFPYSTSGDPIFIIPDSHI